MLLNGENVAQPSTARNYFFLSSTLLSSACCSNFQASEPKLLAAKLLPRDTVVFARKCRKLVPLLHEQKNFLNAILCKKLFAIFFKKMLKAKKFCGVKTAWVSAHSPDFRAIDSVQKIAL